MLTRQPRRLGLRILRQAGGCVFVLGAGAAAGRRSLRDRKVSQRMAVVDESERKQVCLSRCESTMHVLGCALQALLLP